MKRFNLLRNPQGLIRGDTRSFYIILISFITVSVVLRRFHPGGWMAYIFPSVCWTIIALITLNLGGGISKFMSWTNRRVAFMAMLSAAFQIFIMIDAGLINGFGKSPLSFEPLFIVINLTLVSTALLGKELSRGFLVRNLSKKRPELTLAVITVLYTFTSVAISSLLNFRDPLSYSKFMGKTFLPTITGNLLATYVSQIGGPLASLAYYAPLKAFQWFSPILPDLPWGYESIIGVMTPTIGFVAITTATTKMDLMRAGIITPRRPSKPSKEGSVKGWLLISIFFVLATWASTGLLGFYPTIVASGSMRPTMDVGDVAIVVKSNPSNIREGDIIQYWKDDSMLLHRVVEIYRGDEGRLYVTKGDANSVTDMDPVFQGQIKGKLMLTLPKIGWISIFIKKIMSTIWLYLNNSILIRYTALTTVIVAVSFYYIHNHRNKPRRYRMKRRW